MQPKAADAGVVELYAKALVAAVAVEPVLLRAKRAEFPTGDAIGSARDGFSAALQQVDQCLDVDPTQDDMEFKAAIARACASFDVALQKFGAFLFKGDEATPAPAKDDEIEEPAPEAFEDDERMIKPNDEAFVKLQTELEAMAMHANEFSSQVDQWKEENGANREALQQLEDRVTHRLLRARVRNIKFVLRLEKEWLVDEESIAMRKLPCLACVEERIANPRSDTEETRVETAAKAKKKTKKKKKTIKARK